jgi:hypothetical protein
LHDSAYEQPANTRSIRASLIEAFERHRALDG